MALLQIDRAAVLALRRGKQAPTWLDWPWAVTKVAGHDWDNAALAFTAFSLGALILNYVLYQARLVPRWLSVWGLVGAALILAARMMVVFGLDLSSPTQIALDAPIAVQEMAFAVWLIVRGFNAAAFAA